MAALGVSHQYHINVLRRAVEAADPDLRRICQHKLERLMQNKLERLMQGEIW